MTRYGYILVTSSGNGQTNLSAFDDALCKAGVGDLNLIRISSIIPPNSIKLQELPHDISKGPFAYCAYSFILSRMKNITIISSIGVAVPKSPGIAGVIMEYSDKGVDRCIISCSIKNNVKLSLSESMFRRKIVDYDVEIKVSETIVTTDNFYCAFAGCFIFPLS